MGSPTQVSGFAENSGGAARKSIYISQLVAGDKELENKILKLGEDPDDPPILFDWDSPRLVEFWNKSVAYYAGGGAIAPPPQINGGVQPGGAGNALLAQQLKGDILALLRTLVPGPPDLISTALGLACSQNQVIILAGQLRGLELHPWFAAILAHGVPLSAPLASLHHPRPRVASGICDHAPFGCALWV